LRHPFAASAAQVFPFAIFAFFAVKLSPPIREPSRHSRQNAYEERTEQIQAEAEAEAQATAALQSQGLTHDQIRSALLNRLQTRALVTGDFKLAARAINLDLRLERNLITQRRLDLQERRVLALERKTNRKPLTPEGLAKIEKDLHLFED